MPNYSSYKLIKLIHEFRDYLLYRLTSLPIAKDDKLFNEYCKLIDKYEELFGLDDLR